MAMTEHKRGVSGSQAAPTGGAGDEGVRVASAGAKDSRARDNTTEATYWVSHRGGPFLIHKVGTGCEPQTNDNAGYLDNLDTAIEQGFAPCPKCMK